jgi:hypothetical protein
VSVVVTLPPMPRELPGLDADPAGIREHAANLQGLLDRRAALADARDQLAATVGGLRERADDATQDEAPAIQAASDDCARRVQTFETDLDRWITDLMAEEEAMQDACARVPTLDSMPGPEASAREVSSWWHGLTRAQQLATVADAPGTIGNRDGVAPWARDAANNASLDRDLADWGDLEDHGLLTHDEQCWLDNARAAQRAIATIEDGIDPHTLDAVASQLYVYDPTANHGAGALAVAAGHLTTAHDVAVIVPGFDTDALSAPYQAGRVVDLYEATGSVDRPGGVATMFWIGLHVPGDLPGEDAGPDAAGAAGERLADLLDGLRESRDGDRVHVTVIGYDGCSPPTR